MSPELFRLVCATLALLAGNTLAATQEMLASPKGILTSNPGSADGAVPSRLTDSSTSVEWRSPYNTYRNDLEYKFNINGTGNSGLDGDTADLFTLSSFKLWNWSSPYGVKNFQLYVKTSTCGVTSGWTVLDAAQGTNNAFNFLLDVNGGVLTNNPGFADGAVESRLTDGSLSTEWRSPYNTYRNDLEYKFIPDLGGISGLDGNDANLFALSQFKLYNWSSPYSLKDFQVFVKTRTAGVLSGWTPVDSATGTNTAFNFLLDVNGSSVTKDPGAADGTTVGRLTDGSLGTEWRSPYNTYLNDIEYKFDPTLDGTSGLNGDAADLFTLSQLKLYNWSSPYGLKTFQVYAKTKTSGGYSDWTVVDSAANPDPAFNFVHDSNGGLLTLNPGSADGAVASRLTDGSLNTEWRSPYNTYRNDLEYSFDPTLDGTSGFAGDANDLFTLSQFNLYNYSSPYGLKNFQVFVKTKTSGVVSGWTAVDSSASPNSAFNFMLDVNGSTLTANPGAADGAIASRLTDGSLSTEWRSPYNTYRNDLEYKFDPTLNGTSGLDGDSADLFTLSQFNLYNYSSPYALKNFQVFVKTKTSGVVSGWTAVDSSTGANSAFNFMLDVNGSTLTADPGAADGAVASRLTDGSTSTEWRSPYNSYRNDLEYSFDPTLDGTSGLAGDAADLFTLSQFNLYNYASPYALKNFQVFVKTKTSGVVSGWTAVDSSTGTNSAFNFLLDSNGGTLTLNPGQADGAVASRLTDGSLNTEWRSPYNVMINTLEYKFDPNLSGTSGLDGDAADQMTLDRVVLYNYASPYGVKDFQVYVQTKTSGVVSAWTLVSIGGSTTPQASSSTSAQTFVFDAPIANVVALRFKTVNNRGGDRVIIYELEAPASWTGRQTLFTASSATGLQTFTPAASVSNVVALRLRTISNYGGDRTIVYEFETPGSWSGKQTMFTAANSTSAQNFTPAAPVANVVALRLRTLSNYGGDRTIIYEFETPGSWSGKQTMFTAANATGLQNFSPVAPIANVVALRLRTLSNYGGDRTIIYEFETPAAWSGKQTVFTAANSTAAQTFNLPTPVANVAALRLRTLSNYGGDRTIIYEFEAPGSWSGKQTMFTATSSTSAQTFTLPTTIPNVAALRLRTVSNYGGDRTIIYEFEAPNTWSGKQTVFTAANATGTQTFGLLSPVYNVAALRFRTLSNYGGDRVIVYEAQAWGELGDTCSGPDHFNCVDTTIASANVATGHLFTKLVNTPFNFDVVALKTDGSIESTYAAVADKPVTVELVDSCSATIPISSQTLTFNSANQGRKTAANTTLSTAYSNLHCRVKDTNQTNSITSCSTDGFAVRPSGLTVTISGANADTADGTNSSNSPKLKAGSDKFAMTAESGAAGYNLAPTIGAASVLSGTAGAVAGSFSAADSSDGKASGTDFTYSEAGYFRFAQNGIYDNSFTAVDSGGDCTDDFSNNLVGGKYGCKFGNTSATSYIGRFIPDHFAITAGAVTQGCSTNAFTYFGQNFTTAFTVTAQNKDNGTTKNYATSNWKNAWTDYNFTADNSVTLTAGATAPVATWLNGQASISATHVPTRPATPAIPVSLTISAKPMDSDGVTTAAATTINSATVPLRHGRLRLSNAFGSEKAALRVPAQIEYFNNATNTWTINTADNCTTFATLGGPTSLSFTPATASSTPRCKVSLNTCTSTSDVACNSSSDTVSGGNLGLCLTKPSTAGFTDVTFTGAPTYLQNLGTPAIPSARASFGLYNQDGNARRIINRREVR